ncbi:MAG: transposase [Polyangiales bacterium]
MGDKGTATSTVRAGLRSDAAAFVTPSRGAEIRDAGSGLRCHYRRRNVVERLIGWLQQFRRIATRYEKRASNDLAMLTLAAVRIWMR